MPPGKSPQNCSERSLAGSSLMQLGEIPAPGALFHDAYRRLKAEHNHLFRIAIIPTLLYFLILAFMQPLEQDMPEMLLTLILLLVIATLFDVAWLRWLLLAGDADPPLTYRWTFRHTAYFIRLVALHFCLIAAAVPIVVISSLLSQNLGLVVQLLCLPIFYYLSLRLSLFLVASAVGGTCDLRRSWAATREGAWRFFWGAAFTIMPLLILMALIGELMAAAGFAVNLPLSMMMLGSATGFVLRALLLAVTARVYETMIMGRVNN
jgi:hypothetical protein